MSPQRYEMTMTGTLYAVGVGPGAPDLLTLRAVEALRRVDVILAAASPRNDYSRALETARPHLRPDVRLQRLEFPMTHDKATLRAAWEKAARPSPRPRACGRNTPGGRSISSNFFAKNRAGKRAGGHKTVSFPAAMSAGNVLA